MEIKLSNIGLISESTIKLDGLTVITGKNGTGKTTVGKTVYSLIDAVNNLQGKAEIDKKLYTRKKLNELNNSSNLYTTFQSISGQVVRVLQGQMMKKGEMSEPTDFSALYPALCGLRRFLRTGNIVDFDVDQLPEQLIHELTEFRDFLRQFDESDLENPDLLNILDRYDRKHRLNQKNSQEVLQSIEAQITADLSSLERLISVLEQEADGEYAKHYLDRTLNIEFSNQIQPIGSSLPSHIQMTEKGQTIFDVNIRNNHIDDAFEINSTIYKALFIDDPSILDDPHSSRSDIWLLLRDEGDDSYFIPSRIMKHAEKMWRLLRNPDTETVFEEGLRDTALRPIKEKIEAIIPGTFDFSSREEYYIRADGEKIRLSNLASGSKMFSILKILLERGLLDENTILILDEPEIHLHPDWQNQFAELIILLVKELKVKVLLTTHSSNFMLAIDAFMREYEINEQVNFYQAEQLENQLFTHTCVNDHLELIYQDFLKGFSEAKALRDYYVNR